MLVGTDEPAALRRDPAASGMPGEATIYIGPIFNTTSIAGGTVHDVASDYVAADEDPCMHH